MLLCVIVAAGWVLGVRYFGQMFIEDPGEVRVGRRSVLAALLIIAGPPAGLIWLAFSNVLKRACPECSE